MLMQSTPWGAAAAAAAVECSHDKDSIIKWHSFQMKKERHCSKNDDALTVKHKDTCPSNAQRKSKWCLLPQQSG
jgi:hypothetical protein